MRDDGLDKESGTAWISQGFERLVERVRAAPKSVHFDVLVIGSGYGGAIAASTFAGRKRRGVPISVGVLERGKEYLPGAFPTGLGELPRHIRGDRNKEGLFDIRLGKEVMTVVANGVGGGSLINAGVMEVPLPGVFETGWPAALASLSNWEEYFNRARELLGGGTRENPNGIVNHVDGATQKFRSIRAIALARNFRPAAITVAMSDTASSGNVRLSKCVRCGDCATGCNFGAKNSLDVNLLVRAQQKGAEIFSGATVLEIAQDGDDGWIVDCVHTNATLRKRDGESVRIRARKVVLAAGMLGSSEILMRSQSAGLSLSRKNLGERCSTNGDMLVADYATDRPVNTVADEIVKPSERAIGPTITGVIDLRADAGILIEEMSVPAALRTAFTEVFATVNALHGLAENDFSRHRRGFPSDDVYGAPKDRVARSALYAVMADDGAAGRIEIDRDATTIYRDGTARICWDNLQILPIFDKQVEELGKLTGNSGGRLMANPIWKLLPADLAWLLKDQRGPLVTVHPLGGCVMADTVATGVVDDLGRVFSTSGSNTVYDGLVVLDGSIIPTALATNPALTISAVALRAAEILADEWGYEKADADDTGAPLVRPTFRETDLAAAPPSTEVEIIERLVGPVRLTPVGGKEQTRIVELTMRFMPKALADLTPGNGGEPVLNVATDTLDRRARSQLRIFPLDKWEKLERSWLPPHSKEKAFDEAAEFSAAVSGTLRVLERQPTWPLARVWRAGKAWLLNRGLRDIYQALVESSDGLRIRSRVGSAIAIASSSGEVRALSYDLVVEQPDAGASIALDDNRIVATKTFTYDRRCNPWRQLMEVRLDRFPGLGAAAKERFLRLDVGYLARIGLPLFRIVSERDGVSAIGELLAFFGFVTRLLLGMHIWSFRAPDEDRQAAKDFGDRLPPTHLRLSDGDIVAAERHSVPIVAQVPAGDAQEPAGGAKPVCGEVILTRYRRSGANQRPVVMFHGYSASGTTFAHHAVNPNFASYLCEKGRDVWIADLRTSAGQATAREAWSFDQIGEHDVPAALRTVIALTGQDKVDVVAHCMGAVMFSIAVLGKHVGDMVNRAAFTQVGPLIVFSPANIFRAYAVRYLIGFLPKTYDFNPKNPTLADNLWDRLLSTLPYPIEEFDIENPLWPTKRTPWTRTRHRMDALYGRVFSAQNMEPEVLPFINEHFGPLSLTTVSSTMHFVRYATMTNFKGRNALVSRQNFAENWPFPTFSVHGAENGLSHVSTVDRMRKVMTDAGRVYTPPFVNTGAGHQDAVIGTKRHATFERVHQFLDNKISSGPRKADSEKAAYAPWIGPIITEERPRTPALVVRLGAAPSYRSSEAALVLRIKLVDERICRPDNPARPWDLDYIISHLVVYSSSALELDGWDSFELPLPGRMPPKGEQSAGEAMLILLVYDEDASLEARDDEELLSSPLELAVEAAPPVILHDIAPPAPGLEAILLPPSLDIGLDCEVPVAAPPPSAYGYFFADADQKRVLRLDPTGLGNPPFGQPVTFAYERFTKMARALLRAVGDPGRDAKPDATNVAVRPLMAEQDSNLLDGVIPYDPPSEPRTQPDPDGTRFTLSSCQYPAGYVDEAVAYRSYRRIAGRLDGDTEDRPRFSLFVGDQVYVDPTAGLYDPAGRDDRYRLPYEGWLGQHSVRSVLRRIPSFMLLDDHEIDDNWEPIASPDDKDNAGIAALGVEAYRKYQRGLYPDLEAFDFDGFHFFMLDTRTGRSHRKVGADLANATLFDAGKMGRLKEWLSNTSGPKFVLSPVMLLPRHRRAVQRDRRLSGENISALHSDGWDGYPNTLRAVLGHIAENRIEHVVFLSGDEHRGCVATVDLTNDDGRTTRLHSIHTAAMFAPYPFANGIDEEIVASERIEFEHNRRDYKCNVDATRPAPGDGATFLFVRRVGTDWQLDCEFGDGAVQTLTI